MEFLFTLESLGLSFMEICLGANGIGGLTGADGASLFEKISKKK